MCGIAAALGDGASSTTVTQMVEAQAHRGPDATGCYSDPRGAAVLGHNRLSIIDLSDAGRQPMWDASGRYALIFNGEIYNYRELRREFPDYPFRSGADTEVLLAAYARWGDACLSRLVGMFAFVIWDREAQRAFAVRDRFGVKPLYYAEQGGQLLIASEIATLHEAGVPRVPEPEVWSEFLQFGSYGAPGRTFWRGVSQLPGGHSLAWRSGVGTVSRWYDVAEASGEAVDDRPQKEVVEEYRALLTQSVRFRFRSDVPVGINLSGGLDSSLLVGIIHGLEGTERQSRAYTFYTGDERYDELPWVQQMLTRTEHPSITCLLEVDDVPALSESVHAHQSEPFGGIPTLAYARLFERARADGVIVLLDGQGMDEQWAGYDYYRRASAPGPAPVVQGASDRPVRPETLRREFADLATRPDYRQPFPDALRNLQYRDLVYTKIPRALRFNDRVSMRSSVELREPFLDHRLVELALRQPASRKIHGDTGKWFARQIAADLLPGGVVEAPKRPLQTPQREWLREDLRSWTEGRIEAAIEAAADWLDPSSVRAAWETYASGGGDNSFFVWQWISLAELRAPAAVESQPQTQ